MIDDIAAEESQTASQFPSGARILARDEEWLVQRAENTEYDGVLIRAVGTSELVQGEEISLFTALEPVLPVSPEDTQLVRDDTPHFRRGRLFLEAVLRRTPLPRTEEGLALADSFLLHPMSYQQRPAELALTGLRPRILLADVVGLGKTLEIGLILAELIRRGRGERVLVATPQHVLEQFQRELWTRFSIPLVRLDSVGIERIQREIPAGRNPFSYFKRVIVSIDTLKNTGLYGHHLEHTRWDAVVIDESHNLIGETTQRNRLARLLAKQTDALLLASATPHNGDKRSFAELIRLLDPTAISNPKDYEREDIEHLYLRRTKISPEVRDRTSDRWADRGPSVPLRCPATATEELVFAELKLWLDGGVTSERLFPFTLCKSFLSSHHALLETIVSRRYDEKTIATSFKKLPIEDRLEFLRWLRDHPSEVKYSPKPDSIEHAALDRLQHLLEAMTDSDSAKLAALLETLRRIGIGPRSRERVVVFSERIATLNWLARVVPAQLGLATDAVKVLTGGLTDTDQQTIVDEFGLGGNAVRLLLTGDVASEGVNLHRECHQLVHFDLPWSLIRIEQRNGRIDRFGQLKQPQFTALILISDTEGALDDTRVAEKLLEREEEVHRSLGSVDAVTHTYQADREERRLMQALLENGSADEVLAQLPDTLDVLDALLAGVGENPIGAEPRRAEVPTLFGSTERFAEEALRELFISPEDDLGLRREGTMLAFDAPADLVYRMSDLPRSYLASLRQGDRVRLRTTFDRGTAQRSLDEAQAKKKNSWPEIVYVSDVHPMIEWLVDKTLVRLGRREAPVLLAQVDEPVFLVQGVYCNRLGQPTVVEWMAISGVSEVPVVRPLREAMRDAGVGPEMPNPLRTADLLPLQQQVPAVIEVARQHLEGQREQWEVLIQARLRPHRTRIDHWEQTVLDLSNSGTLRISDVTETVTGQRELIDQLETTGAPLLRLLAVLERGA